MAWVIYRHKGKPHIRYWVETFSEPGEEHIPLYQPYSSGLLKTDGEGNFLVRIKAARNVRFDQYDFPPHQASEAGLWPSPGFFKFYEPDPDPPKYSPDREAVMA